VSGAGKRDSECARQGYKAGQNEAPGDKADQVQSPCAKFVPHFR
jgi:hypothetical protein